MTAIPPSRSRSLLGRAARSRTVLWSVFILTHLWLGYQNLTEVGAPLGDVQVQYKGWAQQADLSTFYVGIDKAWVYPILALVPMVLAGIFGFANYTSTWLAMVFVFDLVAFAAMVGWRRRSPDIPLIGWWWIAFLILLGPIAVGRIDAVSVPIAIIGVLLLASRPRVAAVFLTVATWIKVWPAALIAAAVISSASRVRIILTALVTSAIIVAATLALGAGPNVFSFITAQTARGLQIESPTSSIWMWMAFAHVPGTFLFYDEPINAIEITGPNAAAAAQLLNPLFALVVFVVVILGVVAVQRRAPVTELLAPLSLALVTAFIAFNKVGSPQYMTWLAVPVILGLATRAAGHGRSFTFPAAVGLAIAGLTQTFYPAGYTQLMYLQLPLLLALTVRNILILVLFGWSVKILIGLTRPFIQHEDVVETDAWLPAAWPFRLQPSRNSATRTTADEDPTTQ